MVTVSVTVNETGKSVTGPEILRESSSSMPSKTWQRDSDNRHRVTVERDGPPDNLAVTSLGPTSE
jgi:hypothetical protein